MRQAYVACAQAVNDELTRQQTPISQTEIQPQAASLTGDANGNGRCNGTHGGGASQKQLGYANQLAGQIQALGARRLEELTGKLFDRPLAGLSSLDASTLIDTLKAIKDGRLSMDNQLV